MHTNVIADGQVNPVAMAALQPVHVRDWTLFAGYGGYWTRDIDIAERAGLREPRRIRRAIRTLLKKGALKLEGAPQTPGVGSRIFDPATNSAENTGDSDSGKPARGAPSVRTATPALLRQVTNVLPVGGNGGAQEVTEYYLNREAALLVIMKLSTPRALELQVAVVEVFLCAMDGRLPPAVPDAQISRLIDERFASVDARLRALEDQRRILVAPSMKPNVASPQPRRARTGPRKAGRPVDDHQRALLRMLERRRARVAQVDPLFCPCGELLTVQRLPESYAGLEMLRVECPAGHRASIDLPPEPRRRDETASAPGRR